MVLDSINLTLWSQMLRVSPRSRRWIKRGQLVHHFICCLFAFPLLQWHKLMVSGKKVVASDSGSIIWCSQIFWFSDSGLKCSSMLKNDSGNGIVRFCAYHLQIISISDVLCEQWKRHLTLFMSVSPMTLTWTWSSHWIIFFSLVIASNRELNGPI